MPSTKRIRLPDTMAREDGAIFGEGCELHKTALFFEEGSELYMLCVREVVISAEY